MLHAVDIHDTWNGNRIRTRTKDGSKVGSGTGPDGESAGSTETEVDDCTRAWEGEHSLARGATPTFRLKRMVK